MTSLELENIKCGGCANTIKTTLLKMENVEDVKVDFSNGKVEITGEFDKEKVLSTLSNLGYPEKGSNTIIKQGISYISCAVGKINS